MIRLIGRSPEEAAALLEGRALRVEYINPPRGAIEGVPRVVRIREEDGQSVLDVCVFPPPIAHDKDGER